MIRIVLFMSFIFLFLCLSSGCFVGLENSHQKEKGTTQTQHKSQSNPTPKSVSTKKKFLASRDATTASFGLDASGTSSLVTPSSSGQVCAHKCIQECGRVQNVGICYYNNGTCRIACR